MKQLVLPSGTMFVRSTHPFETHTENKEAMLNSSKHTIEIIYWLMILYNP